jgi:Tfp pilus assembly protein PilE
VTIRKTNGFALIDLMFVCGIIGVLATIAVPRLVAARNSATITAAVATMRTISTAQLSFAISCGNGFYAPDLPALAKVPVGSSVGFVGPDLGAAQVVVRQNFTVQMEGTAFVGAPDTCNQIGANLGAQAYRAGADPLDPSIARFFAINALGVVYEDSSPLYPVMPESAIPPAGQPVNR